ncbi:uncharacterized protein SETTUDRAFT_35342 [Exserohilum turcica Et28A]|uniref:Uncharacterized protein n=1 Tax=Exserohilum turcicum (strain 28A) TaxID=671987 RepID=R0JVJ3_EXST2|nr:uncharacterized protein SETTUDRAFT_35342 [Exserohilum turcica Et28A]EOA81509.1 hypothetical protein SETTUDRAFT_35342 [Exserohilum turcica Et28A]
MHSSMLAIFFAIGAPVVSAVATVNSELGCVCMERAPRGHRDQANYDRTQGGCDLYGGFVTNTQDFYGRATYYCVISDNSITPATWDQDWCRKHWPTSSYGFCNKATPPS